MWVAHIAGLECKLVRKIAQEAEAGQIAFDLRRHSGLLELGR
jgi:hypothetical protein